MDFRLNEYHQGATDQELLDDVLRVSNIVGDKYLSFSLYKSKGKYSEKTFTKRFGSWPAVLEKTGLRTEKSTVEMKRVSDSAMIGDVRRISTELSSSTVTTTDYKRLGKFALPTIIERFGAWTNLLEKAGLGQTNYVGKIDDIKLFNEIERIWVSLGKQPTTTEMKKGISKYSLDTFMRRFGGWRNALKSFTEYVDSTEASYETMPTGGENIEKEQESLTEKKTKKFSTKRTSRNINLKLRFTVLQRDSFTCQSCGASPAKKVGVKLHVDHIVAWSKGGETEVSNLQTLCSKCNLGKSDHEFA